MPMGFYTIEQTKDCINHTEQQLRELISTILSRKYGPDWEHSSSVWDETTRKSLEIRRQEDQGHHPYQIVSQLDFIQMFQTIDSHHAAKASVSTKRSKSARGI
jgi:hypothetical protein